MKSKKKPAKRKKKFTPQLLSDRALVAKLKSRPPSAPGAYTKPFQG